MASAWYRFATTCFGVKARLWKRCCAPLLICVRKHRREARRQGVLGLAQQVAQLAPRLSSNLRKYSLRLDTGDHFDAAAYLAANPGWASDNGALGVFGLKTFSAQSTDRWVALKGSRRFPAGRRRSCRSCCVSIQGRPTHRA